MTRLGGKRRVPEELSGVASQGDGLLIDDLSGAEVFPLHFEADRQLQLSRVVELVLIRHALVDTHDATGETRIGSRLFGQAIRRSLLDLLLDRFGELEFIPAAEVGALERGDVDGADVGGIGRPDGVTATRSDRDPGQRQQTRTELA